MTRWTRLLLFAGFAAAIGLPNYDIFRKQRIVDHGTQVLLELRPADPRSLMQGDYMSLSYHAQAFPPPDSNLPTARRGSFIVKLQDGVAYFSRLDDGGALADGEIRLAYKRRAYSDGLSYGADSFFFQEGTADLYADARFGVLRVDADGNSILVDLADKDHRLLTPPR